MSSDSKVHYSTGLTVKFESDGEQVVSEGEQIQVCLTHSSSLERDVIVLVNTESTTASGEELLW